MSGIIGGAGLPKSGTLESFAGGTYSEMNIGKMRIIVGSGTAGSQTTWTGGGSSAATYYALATVPTYSGFAEIPKLFVMAGGGSHQTNIGSYYQVSATSSNFYITSGVTGQVASQSFYYILIGKAS